MHTHDHDIVHESPIPLTPADPEAFKGGQAKAKYLQYTVSWEGHRPGNTLAVKTNGQT